MRQKEGGRKNDVPVIVRIGNQTSSLEGIHMQRSVPGD